VRLFICLLWLRFLTFYVRLVSLRGKVTLQPRLIDIWWGFGSERLVSISIN
jgi:hypothetical protein